MTVLLYLLVAGVMLFVDSLLCHALKRRFRLQFCIPFALAWPFTMPLCIIGCAYLTRNFPRVRDDTMTTAAREGIIPDKKMDR